MKKRLLFAVSVLAGLMALGQPGSVDVYAADTVCGDFTVTGGVKGDDYNYGKGVLRIFSDTPITIKNTDPSVATTDHIVISYGVDADITLAGVNIEIPSVNSGSGDAAAIYIEENSTGKVTIRLADGTENTLTGGWKHAGIEKNGINTTGTLTITGKTGVLNVTGGRHGAGIGARDYGSCININIEGGIIVAEGGALAAGIGGGEFGIASKINIKNCTVTATGGSYGAGIGGGNGASGMEILIENATVMAEGGTYGAGIGGGKNGNAMDITIKNSKITAAGGDDGAGIGGGLGGELDGVDDKIGGDAERITIEDSNIEAMGRSFGAGIGGGTEGNATDITIKGGKVVAVGENFSAGIGGGNEGDGINIVIIDAEVVPSSAARFESAAHCGHKHAPATPACAPPAPAWKTAPP